MEKQDVYIGPDTESADWADRLRTSVENGTVLIHWQMDGGRLPRETLWKASKYGIWNHVSGRGLFEPGAPDREWIVNNPNIVHSFEDTTAASYEANIRGAWALYSYKKLPAVPGQVLWQEDPTPEHLLYLLSEYGKDKLIRLRREGATGKIRELGTRLEYFFKRPKDISPRVMTDILTMVEAGGSVDITHVRANLETAYLIGYVTENGVIAGNSSLKHPRQVFIDRLKGVTGLDFSRCVERGYTSVRPEYRAMGIGAKLLEGLTLRATDVKIFSIISEDNLATQKIAVRNNTRKVTTYFSDKLGKEMGVWMPEGMMPEKVSGADREADL